MINATENLRNVVFFSRVLIGPLHCGIGDVTSCCKDDNICECPLTSLPQIGAKTQAVKGKQPKIIPTTDKDTPLS